jgi:23S rRNA (guanosine2251-2'-O)-methyltransferase
VSDLLYGRQPVYEALRAARRALHRLWVADNVRDAGIITDILALAGTTGTPVERVDFRRRAELADVNHQGVALEAGPYPYVALEEIVAAARQRGEPPFILILDLLKDPQNVGSIMRTAEGVGVHGAVIQDRRAASVTPAVVRASAGAVEHLPVAQVTNIARSIEWLKEEDVWVTGLEAVPEAQRYDRVDLTGAVALVVGSEGKGMRRLVRERCDFLARLPMRGHVDSLNASIAGSILLYEAWRQRNP